MCGRFGLFSELDDLAEQFNFAPTVVRDIYQPRWNIPPTTGILTVQSNTVQNRDDPDNPDARIPRILRWGMPAARPRQGAGTPGRTGLCSTPAPKPSANAPPSAMPSPIAAAWCRPTASTSGAKTRQAAGFRCGFTDRMAHRWPSPASGQPPQPRTGLWTPAPSSPAPPTNWSLTFTTECPSSCNPTSTTGGCQLTSKRNPCGPCCNPPTGPASPSIRCPLTLTAPVTTMRL